MNYQVGNIVQFKPIVNRKGLFEVSDVFPSTKTLQLFDLSRTPKVLAHALGVEPEYEIVNMDAVELVVRQLNRSTDLKPDAVRSLNNAVLKTAGSYITIQIPMTVLAAVLKGLSKADMDRLISEVQS